MAWRVSEMESIEGEMWMISATASIVVAEMVDLGSTITALEVSTDSSRARELSYGMTGAWRINARWHIAMSMNGGAAGAGGSGWNTEVRHTISDHWFLTGAVAFVDRSKLFQPPINEIQSVDNYSCRVGLGIHW